MTAVDRSGGRTMSVKIRLTRTGARNMPSYRIVAADARSPRDGRCLEVLGWYDPKRKDNVCEIKQDRYDYWVRCGAQVSDTVKSLVQRLRKAAAAA
jgi:small subunit ribosomal protein S16